MDAYEYKVIGLMSGTSLDGLDIAFCHFVLKNNTWSYEIKIAETIDYTDDWRKKLSSLENTSALDFMFTDSDYGHYLGLRVSDFIIKHQLKEVDFVASHGHTIFHQPEKKLTV